jgi:hypothetical protein
MTVFKRISRQFKNDQRQRSWLELMGEAIVDPDHADMTSLRYAYALSDAYDPYLEKGEIKAIMLEANQAAEAGEWPRAIETSLHVLKMNCTVLFARMNVIQGYHQTGQDENALPHEQFLRNWMRSVYESGTGENYQTARVAVSLDEEYMFLRFYGALQGFEYRGSQRLYQRDGHYYDSFEIYKYKEKQAVEIYFNIDLIMNCVKEGRA